MNQIREILSSLGIPEEEIDYLVELSESGEIANPSVFRFDMFMLSASDIIREQHQFFLDLNCVTFGDAVQMIERGGLSEAQLMYLVNLKDEGSNMMPVIIIQAAAKKLLQV